MADVVVAPLAGAQVAYGALTGLKLVLLSGRSVTPGALVGSLAAIAADVMAGVSAVDVTGWSVSIDAAASPPRAEPTFDEVTVPAVPAASGPITGIAIYKGTTEEVVYHLLLDPANEVATSDEDIIVGAGDEGAIHIFAQVP